MKKTACSAIILLISACLVLTSCSGKTNPGRTLDGSYANDELGVSVGYIFGADGFGYQLIGSEVFQIKYTISGGKITIENFSVEGGSKQAFDFYEGNNYVRIGGIKFTKVENSGDISEIIDAYDSAQ